MAQIRNVHTRLIAAPAETVGAFLERLSAADDPLWPTPVWPPMLFDRPLGVGAEGGHGFIRYRVSAHEPGRRVRFTFAPPENGFHELTVEPVGPDRCRVRHTLHQTRNVAHWLIWAAVIGPLHDVVVEEVLDNVERLATGEPERPVRWSPRVRALHWLLHRFMEAGPTATSLPGDARLVRTAFARPDYTDAWRMPLRPGMPREPEAWGAALSGRVLPVLARTDDEVLLGKDARHLDYRASLHVDEGKRVTFSTVVKTHSAWGRAYFAVVRRVHPVAARAVLRRTHRKLMLSAPNAAARAMSRTP
ncbi:DUF2867 domain-containing protein [Streptomyces sp. NPDC003077]|uniref:DUF2867 domain-containing protein n=1 Tax=Streptomyces sp. NPDC003077 TaxID=3154443 RepID=UPI00339F3698